MGWFFERAVLRGDRALWGGALPLRLLLSSPQVLARFPPVCVVHGGGDGLVPVEQSLGLLAVLAGRGGGHCVDGLLESDPSHATPTCASTGKSIRESSGDRLIVVPWAKHSFELAASPLLTDAIVQVWTWMQTMSE